MAPQKLTTMYLIKAFFRRITKDFRQKELLPLKLLFFMHASTLFVLYPYLTIHMRELGINVEETAIMSAVTPVVAIIMPPLAGMVADRIGNFKILLAAFSALGGGVSLLLLLVPVGRVTITYPENLTLSLGCGTTPRNILELRSMEHQDSLCHVLPALGNHKVAMHEISCGFECEPDLLAGGPKAPDYFLREDNGSIILGAQEYDVSLDKVDGGNISGVTFSFSMPSPEVLKFGTDRYYFPTPGLFRPSCEAVEPGDTYRCKLGSRWQENAGMFHASRLLPLKGNKFLMTELTNWTVGAWDRMVHNATCANTFLEEGEKVSVSIGEGAVRLMGCEPRCLMAVPRRYVCSNIKKQVEHDISLTFWSYLVVRVLIGIIGGTAFAMFEGAVIAILREQNADYGLQRIYATIGGMISSPLSGMLIDWASKGKGYTDFRPAFYLYAALKIVSGLLMLTINLEFKAPATNVVSDVITVLKNVEIVALFIAIFVLGTAWGYLESFLFWLLQDLGGSRSLMGITITVGGVAGIPLLVLSGPIIDRIGHANVLFIGFMFYAIRLLGYSLIYNPWLCLIFEAMESVTSSLSFTAAVTYAAKLSTTTTDTSIQGLLGGLYFGVGKGAGSLIGGYIMKGFGTRPTYRVFAVACTITGVVYFLFNKFYLRRRPQVEGNDIVKKKPPPKDINGMVEIDLKALAKNNHNNSKKEEKKPINKNAKSYFSAATNQKDVPPPRPAIPPASCIGNNIVDEQKKPENDRLSEITTQEQETEKNNSDGTCKVNLGYEPGEDEKQNEQKRTNSSQNNVEKERENMSDTKDNRGGS